MFFLSYARADETSVQALVVDLRQLGDVWLDQQIAGGQAWWQEILRNIRVADLFVFALSEASLASPACRAEFNYALATRRPILPVQVGEAVDLPRVVGELQIVDYRAGTTTGGVRLATAVRRFDGYRSPLPNPLPPAPPPPEPSPASPLFSLRRRAALIVAGVLAAVLAASGLALARSSFESPAPGTLPAAGSTPTESVANDSHETVHVPDLTGQNRQVATTTLGALGLRVATSEVDGGAPAETVTGTSPGPGAAVSRGSTVILQVSRGNRIQVPSLIMMTPARAASVLSQAGFTGTLTQTPRQVPDTSQVGVILSQNPGAGTTVDAGGTIQVVVGSNGP
ncbi:hypothetical protein Acsp06_43610 [Actinomycetospora sp. NBRC 106375]|uniref:PASTA domain-containing protein n=1 Tax=Actinomycetospora sp. NBRC 106375 TaxID=3032207 RepID=UPI0024A423CC|nr:PASTA domain-containing protein [Actinomycetospora sp. NBRC 106375]GLZ48176.1 hypothetical protein Acsp06_43610 [Actinomycetospora sp. NBRC 106375]